MVYLGEAQTSLTGVESTRISDSPVPAQGSKDDVHVFERCPANWTDPLDLTRVMSDFVPDCATVDQIRRCVRELIEKNGADWVWSNKEIVSDFLEFHGFRREKGSLGQTLDSLFD